MNRYFTQNYRTLSVVAAIIRDKLSVQNLGPGCGGFLPEEGNVFNLTGGR